MRTCALVVIPCYLHGNTGDSINERQWLEALSRKVDKIIIFSMARLDKKKEFIPSNIISIRLPFLQYFGIPHSMFYSFLISLLAYLLDKLYRYNFIYIRDTKLAIGFMLFKSLKIKTVVKFPSFVEDELKLQGITARMAIKIFSIIDRIVLSECEKIAVPSSLWVSEIAGRRHIRRNAATYLLLPAGISLSKISSSKYTCRTFEIKAKYFRVGFLGTIYEWQGVDILLQAMCIVEKKVKYVELIIVGDGPLRGQIEDLSNTLGVTLKITGYVPHETSLKMLSTFDVLVLPRRRTTTTESNIPIKVIEAWALGVPVIVTRHKIFDEMGLKDGEHLMYCKPNPEDVANVVLTILTDDILRKKLEENGPKIAIQFDYNQIAERLLSALNP